MGTRVRVGEPQLAPLIVQIPRSQKAKVEDASGHEIVSERLRLAHESPKHVHFDELFVIVGSIESANIFRQAQWHGEPLILKGHHHDSDEGHPHRPQGGQIRLQGEEQDQKIAENCRTIEPREEPRLP